MRDTHQHNTRHATQNTVTLNKYKTAFYGTHSIKHQLGLIWNQINNEAPSDLLQKSRSEVREYITNKLMSNYQNNNNNSNQLSHILHYKI